MSVHALLYPRSSRPLKIYRESKCIQSLAEELMSLGPPLVLVNGASVVTAARDGTLLPSRVAAARAAVLWIRVMTKNIQNVHVN